MLINVQLGTLWWLRIYFSCVAVERRYIELFLQSEPNISAGGYSSFEGLFVLFFV